MNLDDLINDSYQTKFVDQGSDQWEQIRAGRFTSSEIYKLMECGTRPMTPEELAARPKSGKGSATKNIADPTKMGDKGMTYIYQKVAEVLTGRAKPGSYAYPLVYGKETEPQAVEHFERVTGLTCVETGFEPFSDHAGGSPDRLIGDDEGLEVKSPFYSEHQISYLMLTDRFDLKNLYPEYYWQCVSLLLFTGRKKWHFCTFDPRMIKDEHKMTHIEILASDVSEDFDRINTALAAAIKIKLETLELLTTITPQR